MSTVISVLVSCVLSATSVATAVSGGEGATGRCAGSYVDQASGQVVGAWSMLVSFERDPKGPAGIRAVKTAGAAVLPRLKGNNAGMKALDIQTLQIIANEVTLEPARGFGLADPHPLVL